MKRKIYFFLLLLTIIVSCKKNDPEPDLDSKSSVIYQDSLSIDKKVWISDSTIYHVRKFYKGQYSVREDSIDTGGYSLAPYETINFPYSIQVDGIIQLDDPNKTGYIGIVFNVTDNNHYSIFEINNNGMYFIWTNNNGSITSMPYTQCASFKTGSGVKNTLKLSQNSHEIQLRINNVVTAKFKIAMPGDNMQAGVFVGTMNVRAPSNVDKGLYYSPTTGLFKNFTLTKN